MKRAASIISVLLLGLSAFSAAGIYSGGSGTESVPYQIGTVEDWQELTLSPGDWDNYFVLTNDIDFEGLSLVPAAPDTDPLLEGFQGVPFVGSIDGQGFSLKTLMINRPDHDFVGLVGEVGQGGQLVNLEIEDISVIGRSRVGGLAGRNNGGWISGCSTTGSVAGSDAIQTNAGGLVGANNADGTVIDCYSTCAVSGVSNVGGLVGQLAIGSIRRCYAAGDVTATGPNSGGLVGFIYDPVNSGSIMNSYATGRVSGEIHAGGLVGGNYRGTVFHCYATGRPTGTSGVGGLCGAVATGTGYQDTANFWDTQTSQLNVSAMGMGRTTAQMKTSSTFVAAGWNFGAVWWLVESYTYPMLWPEATSYSGGSGTLDDPYQIGDGGAWKKLMWSPTDWDKHFILTSDIDFNGTGLIPVAGNSDWLYIEFESTIASFSGTLDGQGHVLRNAIIDQPNNRLVGLFGYVGTNGKILNLGVEAISVVGASYVGGLAGRSDGTITSCYATGRVGYEYTQNRPGSFGGLVGVNYGTIGNCYATGAVTGYNGVGGMVGQNSGSISGCFATGPVSGFSAVGGLCGAITSWQTVISTACTITDSYATGDVTGNIQVGGFLGYNSQSRVIHCYSTGKPTGLDLVGGFCGSKSTGTSYEDTGNFWDVQTSQTQISAMGTGKSTALMKTLSTFTAANWDFGNIWILSPDGYPCFGIWVEDYSGGVGSESNPFRLGTVEDWLKLIDTPMHWGRYFRLTNTIDFEGLVLTPVAPDADSLVEGFQGMQFTGSFDGQGYVLRNAVIHLPGRDFVGLFGEVGPEGKILNLCVENVSVTGLSRVGGLAGRNNGGWISGCSTTGSVAGTNAVQTNAGGLVGAINADGTVIDCYSTCAVSGVSNVGGLVGQLAVGYVRRCHAAGPIVASGENAGGLVGFIFDPVTSGTILNSYATGAVSGGVNVGGLVGQNYRSSVNCCYAAGVPTGTGGVGGLCGLADTGEGYLDANNFWDMQTSQIADSAMGEGRTTSQMKSLSNFTAAGWNFDSVWWMIDTVTYPTLWPEGAAYSGGDGTAANPYQIGSTAAWRKLIWAFDDWDKYFVLTDDIDFGGRELLPVAAQVSDFQGLFFSGCFDGQDHVLRNAVIHLPDASCVGLFGFISGNGRVRNVTLENITVCGSNYVGGLAGWNDGLISSCHTTGEIFPGLTSAGQTCFGGLAGFNQGTISNSSAAGTVRGGDYVGGLAGYNSNVITSCSAAVNTRGINSVGGLCGFNQYSHPAVGTISDAYATGDVLGVAYVGGLVGINYDGRVLHCYSTGKPAGNEAVGGFCGQVLMLARYQDIGNFWDMESSQMPVSAMGFGHAAFKMKMLSTFLDAGWDFTDIWELPDGDYPRLLNPQSGYSGGFGSPANPFRIRTVEDWLTLINSPEDWDNHFALTNDIDFDGVALTPVAPDTNPFDEGFQGASFIGSFDGQGFVLKNARLTLPHQDFVGLFGQVADGGQILNMGAKHINVTGRSRVGGLAGRNNGGWISNCFTSGSVTGTHATQTNAGGLVGAINADGTVIDCYSTCSVSGVSNVGGLAGQLAVGYVRRCHAAGPVVASGENAGGLVGFIFDPVTSGTILNSYATGAVSGGVNVGGLVGQNYRSSVNCCYAAGVPTGTGRVGGLCGLADTGEGYLDANNFWDTQTSQAVASAMGSSKTTVQMKTLATFKSAGWNFETTWGICAGTNYPRLQRLIPAGDWVCPDGASVEDLDYFAGRWLLDGCSASGDCGGADLDGSGTVDLGDWAIFAGQWLSGV